MKAIAILLLALTACSGPQVTQQLNTETLYKRDMIVTVNGVTEEGVLVVPLAPTNKFNVEARGDLDLFTLQTCHREWSKEKAWNVTETIRTGLFGWGKRTIDSPRKISFEYNPIFGVEDLGSCPVQLSGYAKAGQHSWAFIDFKTPTFTLQGDLLCNGLTIRIDGVAACQARAGLFQRMVFKKPVFMSPDAGCQLDKNEGTEFNFPMNKGICVYRIKERESGALAKVTLIGYDSILIRGN